MTYFLMNKAYDWVIVSKATWDHPPDNMINNSACISRDGHVHIDIVNVLLHEACELVPLLKSVYEAEHRETKNSDPIIDEDKYVLASLLALTELSLQQTGGTRNSQKPTSSCDRTRSTHEGTSDTQTRRIPFGRQRKDWLMFTELGRVIAASRADMMCTRVSHDGKIFIPFTVVSAFMDSIEGQTKRTEQHIFEALGGNSQGE